MVCGTGTKARTRAIMEAALGRPAPFVVVGDSDTVPFVVVGDSDARPFVVVRDSDTGPFVAGGKQWAVTIVTLL